MAKPPKTKNNDNKTAPEKGQKVLSPKRLMELDHLQGKHKEQHGNCEYCSRRASRMVKKEQATKRYLLANQK